MLSRARTLISDFAASMDAAVTRMGHLGTSALLWPILYAVAVGSGVFSLGHPTLVATLDTNKVPLGESIRMILWVLGTLAALALLYSVAVSTAGRLSTRAGSLRPASTAVIEELHRRMRPLLVLPLLPALTLAAIERDSPKETLFLIGLAGLVTGASAYAWLRPVPRPLRERATLVALGLVMAALWIALFVRRTPVLPDGVLVKILERAPLLPPDREALRAVLPFAGAFIALAALTGALAGFAVLGWLRPAPEEPRGQGDGPLPLRPLREQSAKIAAAAGVLALGAFYGWFFSRLSITNHHALHSAVLDLGFYDNIFFQSAHGRPLGCSFIRTGYHGSAHFDPILVVLSPLYLFYPHAEFLLVLQAVWLGAGVVPVYLLAREKGLGRMAGVALAAMYMTYPAVHGANMYEFHSLTLLAPVALLLLWLLEAGHRKSYWLLLLPTLLVREDVAILLCFVGGYAILSRRPGWARLGWITIVVSIVYFLVVKRFFMTSMDIFMAGKDSYSFAYYYDDLIPNKNSVAGFLTSIFTNPVFVLKTALAEPKLVYVVTLFLPLCFLPFFARPGRFMLAWGIIFCTLASRPAVYSTHFQYSCILIPPIFALVPEAIRQIEDGTFVRARGLDGPRFGRALVAASLVMSLAASWKFGGIVENASFHGGFGPPARGLTDHDKETYAWIREQASKIPTEDTVGATNRTGPHVSNRMGAFFYPEHSDVDWLFIEETELRGPDLERHNKAVQTGIFDLVSRHERFAVYKRRKPHRLDRE